MICHAHRRFRLALGARQSPHGRALFYNAAMPFALIIVIGWLYVTILIAANEPSLVAGIISFLFYGALPCGLIIYFSGAKVRRQRRQYREMMAEKARHDGNS
ncbi:MAG: hypothetical protein LBE81_02495 [Azonexus sp.]|jgi:amino acid permease|uniref:hypothetical protein n=1 Tax=Azonexus sp. TaxID=1872668 RepID=UPI0028236078|nr:hypothetical protein [Azonexus sp.]MDR0775490.1 hypothetical protein [Azonexus sp.]